MREIKIRGQRKYSEEWNYLNLSEYLTSDSKPQPEMLQYLHRNIGQFTGLKDKNGKEIYEEDILKTKNGICSVIWFYAAFALKSPGSEAIDFEHSSVYELSEIIGNIHENPDILTQHKN